MNRAKKCVECGDYVPAYQNFLCEECWKIALNEKLLGETAVKAEKGGLDERGNR
jgi:endogenous inhibitor of DNA gyrase (YacG/DUF329 family)